MYMHERSLKRMLGLPDKEVKRMSKDFTLDPTEVDGVMVYIKPSEHKGGRSAGKHRVMAICPECGKHVSAGRMFQHRKVHGVKSKYRYYDEIQIAQSAFDDDMPF